LRTFNVGVVTAACSELGHNVAALSVFKLFYLQAVVNTQCTPILHITRKTSLKVTPLTLAKFLPARHC